MGETGRHGVRANGGRGDESAPGGALPGGMPGRLPTGLALLWVLAVSCVGGAGVGAAPIRGAVFLPPDAPSDLPPDLLAELPFGPPTPADLPLVAEDPAALGALIEEGREIWEHGALMGELPAPISAEILGALFPAAGGREGGMVSLLAGHGLPEVAPGGPHGLVLLGGAPPTVGMGCNVCHSRVVRGEVVSGLANPLLDLGRLVDIAQAGVQRGIYRLLLQRAPPSALIAMHSLRRRARLLAETLLKGCEETGPGRVPSLRIWSMASRLRSDGSLAPAPAPVPCGLTKTPPLSALRHKSVFFADGLINAPFAARWPALDLSGPGGEAGWRALFASRRGQAIDALATFGTPSLPWEAVARGPIDSILAEEGFEVFHGEGGCAACHGVYRRDGALATYAQRLVPLAEIGTDGERALGASVDLLSMYEGVAGVYIPLADGARRAPRGYIAPPLCSPALNAPFLHTGAVASLEELLRPEAARSLSFWIGAYLDEDALGFSVSEKDAARWPSYQEGVTPRPVRFERREILGHSGPRFGTELGPEEKGALLEYLKRLRCPMPEVGGAGPLAWGG